MKFEELQKQNYTESILHTAKGIHAYHKCRDKPLLIKRRQTNLYIPSWKLNWVQLLLFSDHSSILPSIQCYFYNSVVIFFSADIEILDMRYAKRYLPHLSQKKLLPVCFTGPHSTPTTKKTNEKSLSLFMFFVWLTTQHNAQFLFFSTIYKKMWVGQGTSATYKFLIKQRNPRFDRNGNQSSHTLTPRGQSGYWLYLIKVVNACGCYIISHCKMSNCSSKEHHLLLKSEFYAFRL